MKRAVKDRIHILINEALLTDGAHHKQYFLEEIAALLGIQPIEHEPGVPE